MANYQTKKSGNLFLMSVQILVLISVFLSVVDAFTCISPSEEEEAECEIKRKQMAAEHPEKEIVQAMCGCEPEYAGEEGEWCAVAERRCKTGLVCADLRRGKEIDIYNTWYYVDDRGYGTCATTIPTTPYDPSSTPYYEDDYWKRSA